ncbi:histidine kinase [Oleiphilus sp. HI0071]|jgi:HD-like signal output (HDOD) protein|uniref:HDOD domain-containing protein n=1 Tax=Oleiphilus sp. HI0080 TaxID=1822255 RepID=UPI0007C403DD|nr:HDOD domain-containing protein [Oleiphilus sp. HI0080]KZY62199.1 histidine kinase [Oleiphilus sp. HI0065]KZY78456.1 histidine kinase [Oleiphilus sp. HI0071]KZZ00823.1 histidine kinase [Oleiphilus sp. HI0073]KZZ48246.1 histidine kinase [Oleiphilus sp. HI0122]KZZ79275.1 histidine kinase [Oleiphilus sp. HI0133]
MSELAEKIIQEINAAIDEDKLVLPSLPEVALNVREVTEKDDTGISDLIEVIEKDAALSARLVKVSNSPLFRGNAEISNLNMAVSRLGMAYTSSLAMGLAMQQMFQATSDMIDKRMRQVWEKSTEVAGMCTVLARQHAHLQPGQATLAGLIHSIGALPVLKFVEDNDIQINNVILDNLLEELQPLVGAKILEKWSFPSELAIVPKEAINFTRSADKVDYADLVMVSLLQSYTGTDHHFAEMDYTTISAFDRVGINPDPEHQDEDLNAEMEAAMALLNM